MSISSDQERLEELKKFSTFFDFISNPAAYRDLLTQVNTTLEQMETTINAHTTVEQANGYLQAAAKKVEEVNTFVEAAMEQLGAQKTAARAEFERQTLAIAAREEEVVEAKRVLANAEAEAGVKQTQLEQREHAIVVREAAQDSRMRDLDAQELQLKTTRAKLAALLP